LRTTRARHESIEVFAPSLGKWRERIYLLLLVNGRGTCGSGLARESGVSGDINIDCAGAFASKPAPTWIVLA
jgi:hypothetical protein